MNFLIWNSRGTGSRNFSNLVREISSFYAVDFFAILEIDVAGIRLWIFAAN